MSFRIVDTASRRPGKCALSGDNSGPFIDTGKDIKRYGRVYLSVKFFDEPLRNLGYIGPKETEKLKADKESLIELNTFLTSRSDHLEDLLNAVTPYIPEPEPKTVIVKERITRDPTDEEIAKWIKENGADNPVVREASRVEKGSTEEWMRLYGEGKHASYEKPIVEVAEEVEIIQVDNEGPSKNYTLMDQELNLDTILSENVNVINTFLEGKEEDLVAAVIRREWYLSEKNDREVRKGILAKQGYWDEEDDEPLYPVDEDEEDEEETKEEEPLGEEK